MFLLTIDIDENKFIYCEFDNLENALDHIKKVSKCFDILGVTIEKGDKN